MLDRDLSMRGAQLVACDSPVGRLGLTVCYDLRFPAVYQELVYARGAEVLLVPSAFTVRTGAQLCHSVGTRAMLCSSNCTVFYNVVHT